MNYVHQAVDTVSEALDDRFKVIATKSTVPVGTGREIYERIKKNRPDTDIAVVSNPEFLREGAAIQDFTHPDRVIVGVDDERAKSVISELYRPLYLNETPMLFTNLETAELTKYASNSFLATKITFINEMADICEKVGGNVQHLARGMGLDNRIGNKFLHPSPGYGGSCFPKDTRALVHIADEASAPTSIVDAVVRKNESRKHSMVQKIIHACGGSVQHKTIAMLGLTFKPMTDDMRESASLVIIPEMLKAGAIVNAYDPEGMENAKNLLEDKNITWCSTTYETMENADALVILTEWNNFRNLQMERVKALLNTPTIIDLRNIYKQNQMQELGFNYYSIGRPPIIQHS